ncbi:hypothetical protein Tco_0994630 [Tanacetum coccineum]
MFVETIHVNFDELQEMTSDHDSSGPIPQRQMMFDQDTLNLDPQRNAVFGAYEFINPFAALVTEGVLPNTPKDTIQMLNASWSTKNQNSRWGLSVLIDLSITLTLTTLVTNGSSLKGDLSGSVVGLSLNAKVCDMINDGSCTWPEGRQKDFSVSKVWEAVRTNYPKVNWNDVESHSHLFFACVYSRRLWERLKPMALMENVSNSWASSIYGIVNRHVVNKIWSIIQRTLKEQEVYKYRDRLEEGVLVCLCGSIVQEFLD